MTTGLLLVGHGSRDPLTRMEHDAIEAMVRAEYPDRHVGSGFIELSEPPLSVALPAMAQQCEHVVVVPLLLFSGGHMQRDIPKAIAHARQHAPHTRFSISAPFGHHVSTIDLIAAQVRSRRAPDRPSVCLVVGRGASEPEAQRGFEFVLDELRQRAPIDAYRPAYCGVQTPGLGPALDALIDEGVPHVMVAPYLLFTGKLHRELTATVHAAITRASSTPIELLGHLGPAAFVAVREAIARAELSKS